MGVDSMGGGGEGVCEWREMWRYIHCTYQALCEGGLLIEQRAGVGVSLTSWGDLAVCEDQLLQPVRQVLQSQAQGLHRCRQYTASWTATVVATAVASYSSDKN